MKIPLLKNTAFSFFFSIFVMIGCGRVDTSDVLGTGTPGTSEEPKGYTPFSSSGTMQMVYSFVYTDPKCLCSDGSSGSSAGGGLQMSVGVREGFLEIVQTASSGISSQQKSSTVGTQVISSTPISGPVTRSGMFTASGSTLFIDAKVGYIRVSYKIEGQFNGSNWSGRYESYAFFETAGGNCQYLSTFTGSRMN
jgi:hypothetical protein